jgi:hypothetical protein
MVFCKYCKLNLTEDIMHTKYMCYTCHSERRRKVMRYIYHANHDKRCDINKKYYRYTQAINEYKNIDLSFFN